MQTADFNHNDFSNTNEADKNLLVKMFTKEVQNKLESEAKGRAIFKEKTYIEIRIAGQRDAQACRPITHADKQRFPAHWEAYQKRVEPPTEGTPLSEWAVISRTQAEELAFINVKTVEQLSTVADTNIQNFKGGYGLREKALKWLKSTEIEADKRDKSEMRNEIEELKAQIAKLVVAPPTAVFEASEEVPAPVKRATRSRKPNNAN
tara:strand:- start:1061 stop:1678 length:618 start_codon:yes stop_codon:yes gene_type:complete